ncbi:MAG TPA: hypothetical protein DHV56_09325 [Rhodobacter sp.]|nr:hypothetical protein [Rhodobacter sp.]
MAVTRLRISPSEFWRMPPRHFWWLCETLEDGTKRETGLGADDRAQLLRLLKQSKKATK